MTVEAWLQAAVAEAERQGLAELRPLLEGLAESMASLRRAGFEPRADGTDQPTRGAGPRPVPEPLPQIGSLQDRTAETKQPGELSIETLGHRLRAGQVSAEEILSECLSRAERLNGELNAFILLSADEARRQARHADEELRAGRDRGPLHGIPVSLKDLLDVEGQATTAASRVRAGHCAQRDAAVVAHLRRAGAVLVGKTNLHEFAFGTTSEDSAYGPSRHPLDPARSPGGSSGGSAVSVTTGMAIASVGTDTGGSIRIPSAVCGLVGLKPTHGEVSTDGVVPLSPTLDHIGPLARTVTDAWHVYRALCGNQEPKTLDAGPKDRLRLAVPRPYFCDLLAGDVRERFEEALTILGRAGIRLRACTVAQADVTAPVYLQIVLSEAALYHAATLDRMPDRYTQPVRLRLEMARYVLAEDYLRGRAGQTVLRSEVDRALDDNDALILPTLPITAPSLGAPSVVIDGASHPVRNVMLRLTQLFNITGHPAVTLPCGSDRSGLPIGIQVVGRHGETAGLLRTALALEQALGRS